jgi:hypothetical protein
MAETDEQVQEQSEGDAQLTPEQRLESEAKVSTLIVSQTLLGMKLSNMAKFVGALAGASYIAEAWLNSIPDPAQRQLLGTFLASRYLAMGEAIIKMVDIPDEEGDRV